MGSEGIWRALGLSIGLTLLAAGAARAESITVVSDATWRTSAGVVAVTPDWISNLNYDDSDQAGWQFAFKSPSGHNIWNTSNLSSQSPSHARFRYIFDLPANVASASGIFGFDDDGDVWINGTHILNDPGGGASTFDLTLDPSLFHAGQNLIAVDGFDKIAPFSNISVEMTLTLAPEPGFSMLAICLAASLLPRRRR